jgi:hypothetical protein
MFNAVASMMVSGDTLDGQGAFKPSKAKKRRLISPLSTNLQLHEVSLHVSGFESRLRLASLTMGAPCAHVLGFKCGGVRSTLAKINAIRAKPPTTPHGVFKFLQLKYLYSVRTPIIVSQALCAAATASADALAACVQARDGQKLQRWRADRAGLLVHSVCLLSTFGNEVGMIDDFAGAFERLHVVLRLARGEDWVAAIGGCSSADGWKGRTTARFVTLERNTSSLDVDSCGNVVVTLRLEPPEAHAWALATLAAVGTTAITTSTEASSAVVPSSCVRDIRLVPVLFNLGVNEMQSLANAKKLTAIQTVINQRGVRELYDYHARCVEVSSGVGLPPELPTLLNELHALVETEAKERSKNVQLLLVSCYAARLLGAARTTSCKSAKDRTSIFHTLEVAKLAGRAGLLGRQEPAQGASLGGAPAAAASIVGPLTKDEEFVLMHKRAVALANELRGAQGVRLRNCELNVGRAKYAFNALQVQALPKELRPPTGTAMGGAS